MGKKLAGLAESLTAESFLKEERIKEGMVLVCNHLQQNYFSGRGDYGWECLQSNGVAIIFMGGKKRVQG
jgi:hypothetical protein